jgi:hypothetical protein
LAIPPNAAFSKKKTLAAERQVPDFWICKRNKKKDEKRVGRRNHSFVFRNYKRDFLLRMITQTPPPPPAPTHAFRLGANLPAHAVGDLGRVATRFD